jgi:hypothetical protein
LLLRGHGALRFQNAMVFGRGPKLALAGFTLMMLLAVAGMAIFLVSGIFRV